MPGATAAKSLLGSSFRVTAHRGERLEWPKDIVVDLDPQPFVVATLHPSALLRDRSDRRRANYESFVDDLRGAVAILK